MVNISWSDSQHLYVNVIDSDSKSPTFNTVIRTFDAINDPNYGLDLYLMTVSPDGKFAYLWYDDYGNSDTYYLGILNLSTGAFTYVTADALGVYPNQSQISVTPDGKSLLLMTYRSNRARIKIFDLSNPTQPKRVSEITPIPIPRRGFPYVSNYQVVGDHLYALDSSGVVVVFNFRRDIGDFRERGWSIIPNVNFANNFAFSPDGAWLYVTDSVNDLVAVLDTSKLTTGKNVLVTNVRAPYYPIAIDVSPVPPPRKLQINRTLGLQREAQPQVQLSQPAGASRAPAQSRPE